MLILWANAAICLFRKGNFSAREGDKDACRQRQIRRHLIDVVKCADVFRNKPSGVRLTKCRSRLAQPSYFVAYRHIMKRRVMSLVANARGASPYVLPLGPGQGVIGRRTCQARQTQLYPRRAAGDDVKTRNGVCAAQPSDIEVRHRQRVILNEVAARFNRLSHQG